jgi:sugar/nucleoside kinase (ribokinase family)
MGAQLCPHLYTQHVPGFGVDVVDVTGAGDTFEGSLVYARAQGDSVVDSVRFANATVARFVGQGGGPGVVEVRLGASRQNEPVTYLV